MTDGRALVTGLMREGGLYCLTAEPFSLGRSNAEVVRAMLDAGVRLIQYREKRKKAGEMLRECRELRAMTRAAGAALIVNDHIDLALLAEADGVHVGQDDLPVEAVRRLTGPGVAIGLSTHGPEQARAAVAAGADCIGVGPLFATQTKEDVCAPVGLDYLDFVVREIDLPFAAIGGVKAHNLPQVLAHGARTVCLVTEIVGAPDIGARIAELATILRAPR
ncbi:thiamine phosphate synthase [Desulfocurvus vexinensis]|uniref:thiamine phosphate synthase n=1 Tax=Desulfocurvus vexinensis TaxID=399548 RepID=UPI0004BC3039|nr:thiamine phosphate synthase [Desulfocurvus vexinensis]